MNNVLYFEITMANIKIFCWHQFFQIPYDAFYWSKVEYHLELRQLTYNFYSQLKRLLWNSNCFRLFLITKTIHWTCTKYLDFRLQIFWWGLCIFFHCSPETYKCIVSPVFFAWRFYQSNSNANHQELTQTGLCASYCIHWFYPGIGETSQSWPSG